LLFQGGFARILPVPHLETCAKVEAKPPRNGAGRVVYCSMEQVM
jgi:hypothetical protein